MKIIEWSKEFLIITIMAFMVSLLVTFLYNLILHAEAILQWETALRLSIILGIIFTWIHFREKKEE